MGFIKEFKKGYNYKRAIYCLEMAKRNIEDVDHMKYWIRLFNVYWDRYTNLLLGKRS